MSRNYKYKSNPKKVLTYPSQLRKPIPELNSDDIPDKDEHDMITAIRFDIRDRRSERQTVQEAPIYLYMPVTLMNPADVQWEQKGIGWGGATMQSILSGNAVDDTKALAMALGKSSLEDIGTGASNIALTALSDTGQLQSQQIVNPYIKMLFRGLGMRSFEFNFKFTPKSEQESVEIHEIIQRFRECALPGRAQQNLYLTYPKEIQITYLQSRWSNTTRGRQFRPIPWMNQFKPSVITSINIDYASAGYYVPMRDGFPSETMLSLRFTENEIVTRNDIAQGF